MSDKVQISEKQAREMIDIVNACDTYHAIVVLRNSGYIKQSKLEEAREWVKENQHIGQTSDYAAGYRAAVVHTRDVYEPAIAELLEDKSNG